MLKSLFPLTPDQRPRGGVRVATGMPSLATSRGSSMYCLYLPYKEAKRFNKPWKLGGFQFPLREQKWAYRPSWVRRIPNVPNTRASRKTRKRKNRVCRVAIPADIQTNGSNLHAANTRRIRNLPRWGEM